MNLTKYIGSQFAKPNGIGGELSTLAMNIMNRAQYNAVLDNILHESEKKILDVGFGNGYILKKLAIEKHKLFGIDISEDMISIAKKRLRKYKNITLKYNNIENLEFDNDFFNIVYTINTIYFWQDLKSGLEQIYRVLQKDGIFINAFYTKEWLDKTKFTKYGYKKYTPREIEKEANEIGFKDINIIEIQKDKSFIMIIKK